MADIQESKIYRAVTVDPNFSLPPDLIDITYSNPEEKEVTTTRSVESGDLVASEYDEVFETIDNPSDQVVGIENQTLLYPPDHIDVVSQTMYQTTDGRYVVDVVIEVEDIPNVTGYEVGLTKT